MAAKEAGQHSKDMCSKIVLKNPPSVYGENMIPEVGIFLGKQ